MHLVTPATLSREAPLSSASSPDESKKTVSFSGNSSGVDGVHVAGIFVPAGTRVSVPAYTLQRTADAFPAPEEWRPERWFVHDDGGNENSGDGPEGIVADTVALAVAVVAIVAAAEATILFK